MPSFTNTRAVLNVSQRSLKKNFLMSKKEKDKSSRRYSPVDTVQNFLGASNSNGTIRNKKRTSQDSGTSMKLSGSYDPETSVKDRKLERKEKHKTFHSASDIDALNFIEVPPKVFKLLGGESNLTTSPPPKSPKLRNRLSTIFDGGTKLIGSVSEPLKLNEDSNETKSRQKLMQLMGLDEETVTKAQNEAAASVLNSKPKTLKRKKTASFSVGETLRVKNEIERLSAFRLIESSIFSIDEKALMEDDLLENMISIVNNCFKKQLKNISFRATQSLISQYEKKVPISSAPMGIGLSHMDFDRWWDSTHFFGDVYFQGHYFAEHPLPTLEYIHHLYYATTHIHHRNLLKYLQGVKCSSSIQSLSEFSLIQFSDRVTQVSCGPSTIALVSDLGEVYLSSPKSYFPIMTGVTKAPDDWRGFVSVDKLLGRRVTKVACGPYHFAAITDSKEIITWGYNCDYSGNITGQLGHKADRVSSPAIITGFVGAPIEVACGAHHTVILTSKGVFSFGANHFGQLGSDCGADIVQIRGIEDYYGCDCVVSRIACGFDHTLVTTEDGLLFSWGANHRGQLGIDNRVSFTSTVNRITCVPNVINVACGAYHSIVMNDKGEIFTFGSNNFGELGNGGLLMTSNHVPTLVPFEGENVASISSGTFSSFAITDMGIVYAWGMLCGVEFRKHQYTPRRLDHLIQSNLFISSICSGISHFGFIADRSLSNAIMALFPACKEPRCFLGGPLVKTLLSLPHPDRMITKLQNRVLQHIHCESDYTSPYITLDHFYIEFGCVGARVTLSQKVLITNQCDSRIVAQLSCVDTENPKQIIVITPNRIKLRKRASNEVTITLISSKPLEGSISKFINILVQKDRETKQILSGFNFTRCFLIVNLIPTKVTRQEKKRFDVNEEIDGFDNLRLVKSLGTYVPRVLLERFVKEPNPPEKPTIQEFPAVILFLDITGFTSLNERLAQLGPAGPELVSKHINSYFASLIKAVYEHGGDVLKFAGDALICMFSSPSDPDQSLDLLTIRAVQCAFEIQTKLDKYDSNDGFSLTLHIGIGSGNLISLCVGGIDGSWEYLVSGDPLVQLRTAVENSKTGEVVVSPESWMLIKERCDGEPRGNDYYVKSIHSPINVQKFKPISGWPREDGEAPLRCFIPLAVQASLDSQQLPGWSDELRVSTILFVKLNSKIDHEDKSLFLSQINDILCCMQQVIFKYEGMVRQFLSDDKGTVLIAAFGLPPYSHEDDAVRGVKTAIEIYRDLQNLNVSSSIGVTTGQVYCGSVGCPMRQEYAMVGDIVNLSARLMIAADKLNAQILCDQATYDVTHHSLEFETLEPIFVKGKQNAIQIYKPSSESSVNKLLIGVRFVEEIPKIVGREVELTKLEKSVHLLENRHPKFHHSILFNGQAGVGKSLLVNHTMILAKNLNMKICCGISDSVQKTTPLYPFRTLISDLLQITDVYQAKEIEQMDAKFVINCVKKYADKNWIDYAPLLNHLLPIEIPENEITLSITKRKDRFAKLSALLKRLIMNCSSKEKCLFILEDIHYMDPISLDLTLKIIREIRCFLIITLRPIAQSDSSLDMIYQEISEQKENADVIVLPNLTSLSTYEMASHILQVGQLAPSMKQLFAKLNGNPRLIEEMSIGLKDSNSIETNPLTNECSVVGNIDEIALTALKATHQSRLDRLGSDHQLVLKVGLYFLLLILINYFIFFIQ